MTANDDAPAPNYGLEAGGAEATIALPELPYTPLRPERYQPSIGLIGCGGITGEHLGAYAQAGYRVVALTDLDPAKAQQRREEFVPDADICAGAAELLARTDIDIVDITTHPAARRQLIEDALLADKHVLSQKPFVTDLDVGQRLCDLADQRGRLLAVNQNGRWAPWVAWMRAAIAAGMIGEVTTVDTLISWDHTWVKGTPFEEIHHLVLYDFAIHWFDMLQCYTPNQRPLQVYATTAEAPGQGVKPPLLAQAAVQLEQGQANLAFRGGSKFGPLNETSITGSAGALTSRGEGLEDQTVTLHTEQGTGSPELVGAWFPGGFDGAMSELVVAIEQNRQPTNNARNNLDSLALCFAAIESANTGQPIEVGSVRRVQV